MATYYLRFRGQVTGPYADGEVQRMLARELVAAGHEVSTDLKSWAPVRTGQPLPRPKAADAPDEAEDGATALPDDTWLNELTQPIGELGAVTMGSRMSLGRLPLVTGLSCGALLAYTSLAPVAFAEGRPLFWWDASAGFAVPALSALLLGIAAAGVAMIGDAAWRGGVLIGLAGVGLATLLALAIEDQLLAIAATVQVLAAAGAAVLLAHGFANHRKPTELAMIAVGIFVLGTLLAMLASAWRSSEAASTPEARLAIVNGVNLAVSAGAWAALLTIGIIEHASQHRRLRPPAAPPAHPDSPNPRTLPPPGKPPHE